MSESGFDVVVARDEWDRAAALMTILTHDETSGLGFVRMRCDGRRRRWYGTDSVRAVVIEGEPDDRMYDIALSSQLLRFGAAVSNWGPEVCVRVEAGGDNVRVGVRGDDAWLWTVDQGHGYPDVDALVPTGDELGGEATVSARRLIAMVVAAQHGRRDGEDEQRPMWLGVGEGELFGSVDWGGGLGVSQYGLDVDGARGDVMLPVNPGLLRSLVELFPPESDLRVGVPLYAGRPMLIAAEGTTALLTPMRTPEQALQVRVEEVIEEVVGHLGVVRDSDGDYVLWRRSTPVYARLVFEHDPAVLQVFAVLVDDIADSPELFAELNDLNAASTFARLFHVSDQVLAEVDLAAHTLDAHELRVAINRILAVANEIVPTLAAVLGGDPVRDEALKRAALYRNTVVEAEVMPGAMVPITGPAALEPWPFPGVVHVITGWNPQGVAFDAEHNERINRRIAEDIIAHGGRFVHGVGRAADDPEGYAEPSLVAWGLDRDEAVTMGYRASQDAIFEITDTEVRLVSCFDDRIDVWPRVG